MLFSNPRLIPGLGMRWRPLSQAWNNTQVATYRTSHPHESDARVVARTTAVTATPPVPTTPTASPSTTPPLSILPLSAVMRTLAVTTITSVPGLLGPALASLSVLANSNWTILNPDKNVLLKAVLRRTIYAHFCAGETPTEVQKTISDLKELGYAGVILGYAREVVMNDAEETLMHESQVAAEKSDVSKRAAEQSLREIREWKEGTLQTIDLAEEGDFVALKFTGAGRQALQHLVQGLPPSPELDQAITEICDRGRDRKILLLFDAEQNAVQNAIDAWVLDLQRRYNGSFLLHGKPAALIYNTYQAYLQHTPRTLENHLAIAQQESFVLGIKLVRGAYLNSDPHHLFWPTKQGTDKAYDSIARCLITRKYDDFIKPDHEVLSTISSRDNKTFPQVNLVLASHNQASVEKARALRDEQSQRGEPLIKMVYAQLQGMADDISCKLVSQSATTTTSSSSSSDSTLQEKKVDVPKPYKYLVWGTVGECTKYMLRRGLENREAASRTTDTRAAMFAELRRRSFG